MNVKISSTDFELLCYTLITCNMIHSSLRLKLLGFAIFPMVFIACTPNFKNNNALAVAPDPPEKIDGYAPVYGDKAQLSEIKTLDPMPIEDGGKIYVKGNLFYQVETGKGIHVMDISNPSNPQKLHFIQVVGAQELSIKNNTLYTNNLNDLVSLDISDLSNVKELDRIPNMFNLVDPSVPPGTGYYECIDPAKGDVIGWEIKVLHYPKCSR